MCVEDYLIDGFYPMNITPEISDEAIEKAQCFYYKQLLLMIRFCFNKEAAESNFD